MVNPDSYEIRVGIEGSEWFVGVRPPIPSEILSSMGDKVMQGWDVEQFESSTVFRKSKNASAEDTRRSIENSSHEGGLLFSLVLTGTPTHLDSFLPYDMFGVDSPFDTEVRASRKLGPYDPSSIGPITEADFILPVDPSEIDAY